MEEIYLDDIPGEVLAYIAGFFDGEGCICIGKARKQPGYRNPIYTLYISIANTNRDVIDFIQSVFPASAVSRKRKEPKPHWKTIWVWNCSARQARKFLTFVLPYLRVKFQQAELALEFQELKSRTGRSHKLTDGELAAYEDYHKRMRELNRK